MGASRGNAQATAQAVAQHQSSGGATFQYQGKTIRTGHSLHPALDPAFGGKRMSMKPKDKPDKTLISAVLAVDVTGSNADAAEKITNDMPQIHGLWDYLIPDEFHPNLQVIAIDDYYDGHFSAPLQISQFEADLSVMTKWVERLWPVGGGAGNGREAYDAALWAAVYQNQLEIWNDGRKGIFILMFDEMPYDKVLASRLREVYGNRVLGSISDGELSDNMKRPSADLLDSAAFQDMSIESLVEKVKEKYSLWGVMCTESSYYGEQFKTDCFNRWSGLIGKERMVKMEDASDLSELATALIARTAGASKNAIMSALQSGNTTSSSGLRTIDSALTLYGAASIVSAPRTTTLKRL